MIGKNRSRWECHPCKKTAFGSESRAEETMNRMSVNTGKVPVRIYRCPYSNGYHLTSQEEWSYR